MADELVFTVSEHLAQPATPVTLSHAGLTERAHLQEWVLAHPDILAPAAAQSGEVLIISSEFDRWSASRGPNPLDRLDVLGLDRDGRLVVAELKRDMAPDSVSAQAITYASLVSRFTVDDVTDEYVRTVEKRTKQVLDRETALEQLQGHCSNQMTPESLAKPRLVLVAAEFPVRVKATAVWLTEMGVSMSLVQVQAYRLDDGKVVVTASQLYPLPDMEEFTVRPRRQTEATPGGTATTLPHVDWTVADLQALAPKASATVRTVLDNCSANPGTPLPISAVIELSGRTAGQVNGDLAALTVLVKRSFGRRNWPFTWVPGTDGGSAYVMSTQQAQDWQGATADYDRQLPASDVGAESP
jgi:hypothetical protein